ncbi:TPA: hypothetical protein ACH3X3_003587 [Trebouxia sp. C0006]
MTATATIFAIQQRLGCNSTMCLQKFALSVVGLLLGASACMAQTPAQLFDTPFPSTYNGQGATIVPAGDSSQFHFPTITGHADVQQPLATYLQGFPAVPCGSGSSSFNISFGFLYTPNAVPGNSTQDYAVHLSTLNQIANNITGNSTGSDQEIFTVEVDAWLNLKTGVVSALNYTNSAEQATVRTFNPEYAGQVAQELTDAADVFTVQYLNPDTFYGVTPDGNGESPLSYYLYPPPALSSVGTNDTGTHLENEQYWVINVEQLQFYAGFIAMQSTLGSSCNADTAGFYQLAPLLDYLTDILLDVVTDDSSSISIERFGQLNATYVQSNSDLSYDIYATLRYSGQYLPVDQQILDPALNVTESECILLAKNYTLNTANVNGSPPANVWNFCATGICNYTFPNGTFGESISPYAGSHTASTCQFGYSSAVDNNEYVQPAYILPPGMGSAGEHSHAVLCSATHAVLADKSGRNILPPGLGSAGERCCAAVCMLC